MKTRAREVFRFVSSWGGIPLVAAGLLFAGTAHGTLVHRYSFSEVGGTVVTDAVGTADGTLVNGSGAATLNGGMLTLGNDGVVSSNAGAGIDYVDLPNEIISALSPSGSFEAWVTWTGGNDWQRIFDFGLSDGGEDVSPGANDTYFVFVSPRGGAGLSQADLAGPGGADDQQLRGPEPLPIGAAVHVAMVVDESLLGYTFYVNGRAVDYQAMLGFRLALLNDLNNWLARSQYNDALFAGSYDEFRIYDHPLNAGEVLESFLAGPDAVGTVDIGDPVAATIVGVNELFPGRSAQFSLEVDFATETDVPVFADVALTYTSSDPTVATITDDGSVQALELGTTTVVALYGGQPVDSLEVSVVPVPVPPSELRHRYSFNSPTSGELNPGTEMDLVGDADGVIWGGSFEGPADPDHPGSLWLNSESYGYVDLPNYLISALSNATVEIWATPNDVAGNWRRFWDFGTSDIGEVDETPPPNELARAGSDYWFLSAKIGDANTTRLQTNPPGGGEDVASAARVETAGGIVTRGVEHHIVAVYNSAGNTMMLYLNGQLIGSDATATMELSEIDDVNNWLARSQYSGDGYLDSYWNEMRIYEGVLTPLQVAINVAAGPDTVVADPGAPTGLTLDAPKTSLVNQGPPVQAQALADFAAVAGVDVTALDGTIWSSGNTDVVTVSETGLLTPVGVGSAVVTVQYDGQEALETFTVEEVVIPSTLVHRWSFDSPAGDILNPGTETDLVGDADGIIWGGQFAGPGDPDHPGSLLLDDANSAYVDLPNGIVSALENVTIELWATPNDAGGNWQRFWDIGTGTLGELDETDPPPAANGTDYLMLTAKVGDGFTTMLELNAVDGFDNRQILTPGGSVARDVEHHFVAVYNATVGQMQLWQNGVLIGSQPVSMPLSALPDVNVWIGRSNWTPDSFVNAYYNEMRIYEGVLTPLQVAVNAAAGPATVVEDPGALTGLILDAPETTLAIDGFGVQARAVANFANIAGVDVTGLIGTVWASDYPDVVTVSETGLVSPVGLGSTVVTVRYDGEEAQATFTVTEIEIPATLVHRYSFTADATDLVGTADLTLVGDNVNVTGGALVLPGGDPRTHNAQAQDAALAELAGTVNGTDTLTMEFWTTMNVAQNWSKLMMLGTDTGLYMDVTPRRGINPNTTSNSINDANHNENNATAPGGSELVAGVPTYIAAVWNGVVDSMTIYVAPVGGSLVSSTAPMGGQVLADVAIDQFYLGSAVGFGDADYNGTIDEVRVYTGVKTEAEVAASFARGPDNIDGPAPAPLNVSWDGNVITLRWPATSPGTVQSTETIPVSGSWGDAPVTPVEVDGNFEAEVPADKDLESFRLLQ